MISLRRLLVGVVVFAPPSVAMVLASLSLRDLLELPSILVVRIGQISRGEFTADVGVALCVSVMIGAWLRMVTLVIVVLWRYRSGFQFSRSDRPLMRVIAWALMSTPVVVQPMVVPTVATIDSTPTGTTVHSNVLSNEVVLVSVVVAVGIALRIRQRRHAALRRGDASEVVDVQRSRFEDDVRRSGEDLALVRFDLALRSLTSRGSREVRWVIQHRDGSFHAEFANEVAHRPPWTRVSTRVFSLASDVTVEHLAQFQGDAGDRLPMFLPVGTTDIGDVWVNLECVGTFFVRGRSSRADAVWSGLCHSVALSPLHHEVCVIADEDIRVTGCHRIVVTDPDTMHDVAGTLHTDESPCVIFERDDHGRRMRVPGTKTVSDEEYGLIELTDSMIVNSQSVKSRIGETWQLSPLGYPIRPVECSHVDANVIDALVPETSQSLVWATSTNVSSVSRVSVEHPLIADILRDVSFIVRVMGPPSVDHVDGKQIAFERARSEELLVWLVLHPATRRRSAARMDMWNAPVKDATFSNITSDVRRSLTVRERSPDGEHWLGITLTEDLPLHERIVADADILRRCLDHARTCPEDGALEVLGFGLDFVRGVPLSTSRYIWRDATGITTELAMLIVRSASMYAEMALEARDVDKVYWGTAKGLSAVPGHEGLVSLRMRQHAASGDRASLVAEWDSYCRALLSDDWGDVQPSSKMVDLWFELSGPTTTV